MTPLGGIGAFRIGEDGKVYLAAKSEHYHVSLGHNFPGYRLMQIARELGIPNVIARSAFVNYVEEDLCTGCEICLDHCQFDALTMDGIVVVDEARCIGCGVCVLTCPDEALVMVRRDESEIKIPLQNEEQWRVTRAAARGIDFQDLM